MEAHSPAQIRTLPRLPLNWPMVLTILRLLLLPLFLWALFAAGTSSHSSPWRRDDLHWLAVALLVVMALTDHLDGYLARRLDQATRAGAVLDPLADKLVIGLALLPLSFRWIAQPGFEVPVPVILAVYAKEIGVALGALVLYFAAGKLDIFPCPTGRLSTVLQMLLVIVTLLSPDLARIDPAATLVALRLFWWGVVLSAAAATVDYIVEGSAQYAAFRGRAFGAAPLRDRI